MGFSNQSLWSSTLHYHASRPHSSTLLLTPLLIHSFHPHHPQPLPLPPIHLLFQKSRKGGQKNLFCWKRKEQHKVRGEEIKVGVEEKKKTQGMRRNLGHKVCGWVTPPQFQSLHHFSWSALPLHLPSRTSQSSLYL